MSINAKRNKAQITLFLTLGVVLVITFFIIFILVNQNTKTQPDTQFDTTNLQFSIASCIDKSVKNVILGFGETGLPGQEQYAIDQGTQTIDVPIYTTIQSQPQLDSNFASMVTQLTRECISQVNFNALNCELVTDPQTIIVEIHSDALSNKMNVSMTTPLLFSTKQDEQISLPHMFNQQYPFAFIAYTDALSYIFEKYRNDANYRIADDCNSIAINGRTTVAVIPIDATHTYIKLIDEKVVDNNYLNAYIWRLVIPIASKQANICEYR